jgi:flagellar basal body-associated protein FliL
LPSAATTTTINTKLSPETLSLLEEQQYEQQYEQERILQAIRTDLVGLIPFDVQIALSFQDKNDLENINVVGLTDIITDWMSESFQVKSASELLDEEDAANGTVTTTLNKVALEVINQQIQTTTVASSQPLALLTASFKGISLWDRTGTASSMDPELVELIQRATFLEDTALLEMLKTADLADTGFPSQDSVIDVRAYITPLVGDSNSNTASTETSSSGNKNLEIIIIIAIVVACLAFGLLVFAVVWAWKSDTRKSSSSHGHQSKASSSRKSATAAQKSNNNQKSPAVVTPNNKKRGLLGRSKEPNQLAVTEQQLPSSTTNDPVEGNELDFATAGRPTTNQNSGAGHSSIAGTGAGTNVNPSSESIVVEDISSSLTAYYKSGIYGNNGNKSGTSKNEFNDAASLSSMDSYGYSLDGYAPSLGPAQGGYPVGPLQAAKDAPIPVGDEDGKVGAVQEEEEVEDYEAQA